MQPILIVPGHAETSEGHWLNLWASDLPLARWMEAPYGEPPVRSEWIAALDDAIGDCDHPPLLVGHGLGCLAIVHWAARHERRVHGALLAAPVDAESREAPARFRAFAPVPRRALAFPSLLAASSDDPYMVLERARGFAADWGSRFVDLGPRGSLDPASGHGPWPLGEALLAELR